MWEKFLFHYEKLRWLIGAFAAVLLVLARLRPDIVPVAGAYVWLPVATMPSGKRWWHRGEAVGWLALLALLPGRSPLATGTEVGLLALAMAGSEALGHWLREGQRARMRLDALMGVTPGWTQDIESGSLSSVSREEIARRRQEQASLLNETLYSLLKSASGLLSATSVALFWRQDDGSFSIREVYTETDQFNYEYVARRSDGVLGWVIEQDRAWLSSELGGTLEIPVYNRNEGIRSLLITPVQRDGQTVGILYVDSRFVQAFNSGHQTTLEAFARLIVDHVKFNEAAATYDLEKSRAEAFFQASSSLLEPAGYEELMRRVLATALAVVPVDGALLILKGGKERLQFQVQMTEGILSERCFGLLIEEDSLIDWVCRSLQGVYATNTDSVVRPLLGRGADPGGIQSVLIVPLTRPDSVIGALCMMSRDLDRFSPHEIMIFEKLKQIIAVAIHQRQSYRSAKVLANTDPLTRLYNRRYFFRRLDAELKRLQRSGMPGGLIMVDIDFFKKINDEFGHQVGDEVLQRVSALLKTSVREHDLVGRFGGEEFIIFCPDSAIKSIQKLAERIRKKIAGLEFWAGERPFSVTASFGLAGFPLHATDYEQLVQVADASLYQAKEGGRNLVVVATASSVEDAGSVSGSLG